VGEKALCALLSGRVVSGVECSLSSLKLEDARVHVNKRLVAFELMSRLEGGPRIRVDI